jgi:hypothetical protein
VQEGSCSRVCCSALPTTLPLIRVVHSTCCCFPATFYALMSDPLPSALTLTTGHTPKSVCSALGTIKQDVDTVAALSEAAGAAEAVHILSDANTYFIDAVLNAKVRARAVAGWRCVRMCV